MKKKVMFLLLLILAGMGIFLSQNGWCAMAPGVGHYPWDPAMLSYGGGGNNPNNNIIVDTQNSIPINAITISISQTQSAFKRGDKVLNNNFQQKQGNSGQANK